MNDKSAIIELLIQRQQEFKELYEELGVLKEHYLSTTYVIYKEDIEHQYECKLKQHIAFRIAESLAIPIENVIIILEGIDIYGYLQI